jgi:hypothetical protein
MMSSTEWDASLTAEHRYVRKDRKHTKPNSPEYTHSDERSGHIEMRRQLTSHFINGAIAIGLPSVTDSAEMLVEVNPTNHDC